MVNGAIKIDYFVNLFYQEFIFKIYLDFRLFLSNLPSTSACGYIKAYTRPLYAHLTLISFVGSKARREICHIHWHI
jgi:hypothetical protein